MSEPRLEYDPVWLAEQNEPTQRAFEAFPAQDQYREREGFIRGWVSCEFKQELAERGWLK